MKLTIQVNCAGKNLKKNEIVSMNNSRISRSYAYFDGKRRSSTTVWRSPEFFARCIVIVVFIGW